MLCTLVGVFVQAVGGFAAPGTLSLAEDIPNPIVASAAGSVAISGVFTPANGTALEAQVALFLYVSSDSEDGDFRRGRGLIDSTTGAFTADIVDIPPGSSEIVFSFAIVEDETAARLRRNLKYADVSESGTASDPRRLLDASGVGSVHTAQVTNENECNSALTFRLDWADGDSDVDLWVYDPSGGLAVYYQKQGVRL